jgi:hypothetical protein
MFGLMQHSPRLPYCGTCKTLGALYGHRARVLLNHDTVFLAEVLMEVSGEPAWSPPFRSFNCLTLPRKSSRVPLALDYAAAVTVVLAHFRVADHCQDSRKLKWKLAAHWLSPQFARAAARLRRWGFPLDEMAAILATQPAREVGPRSLADVAEPTMFATALVFSHGARLVGRADLVQEAERLGREFGAMVYLLDAYEDRDRDSRNGEFNPLLAFPGISAQDEILAITGRLEHHMTSAHAARLRINVEERLGLRPHVLHGPCRESLDRRWRHAVEFARSLREREGAGFFKGIAMLASVSALAFLFPQHARRADSWHECLGVSMNLMALATLFAAPQQPPPPGLNIEPMRPDKPAAAGCGSGCKDSCMEGCAEGVCEAACSGCG